MDSFEAVVASILHGEGYWVKPSYKVKLTKAEKVKVGRPSAPRWELDLVAYKGKTNEILVVECKSFIDSTGVRLAAFESADGRTAQRYKLFNDATLRRTVLSRLRKQMTQDGLCRPNPTIMLCLAAGKIKNGPDRAALERLFARKGWQLWDVDWLKGRLKKMADSGYDNQVAAVVAKLLLRGTVES